MMNRAIETNRVHRRAFVTGCALTAAAFAGLPATAEETTENPTAGIAGYTYRLPGFRKGSRILFQGDSITDMNWGRKQRDRNHYLGHSYVYLIVARLAADYGAVHIKTQDIFDQAAAADTPEQWMWDGVHPLPQGHELIARNRLNEVSARWPEGSSD